MSVYTELSQLDINNLLSQFELGTYVSHQGISAGVENTNYFVNTDTHALVLTLFEKHSFEELPFYLTLGEHLHRDNCKVPQPFRCKNGDFLQRVKGKPAVFIERLKGGHVEASQSYALEIAKSLAEIHRSTETFESNQPHSHGINWVTSHANRLLDTLSEDEQLLLKRSLFWLEKIPSDLPKGIIHADLFHDNALFDQGHITGIIDWYFAGEDSFVLDIAIALNDWCLNSSGQIDLVNVEAFVQSYHEHRPLSDSELNSIGLLQIQAATRFWLSRILAKREHVESDENITVKNPDQMKALLSQLLSYTEA